MSVDAAIALLTGLILVNYWISRSVLYPPLLFCGMWFLDLSLYRLDLTPIYPLHPETIGIIGLGAVLFSMGGGLAMLAPRNLLQARMIISRFPPRNNIVKPAVTFFLFCGLPLLLSNLLAMAAQGTGNTIFQRARTGGAAAGQLSGASPLGTYFILWALYAAPLFLLERRDWNFRIMAGIAFIASILSTGRLPLLMLISSLTCAQLMITNRHTFRAALKFARIPILIFLCLYFGLIFVTKDTSVFDASIGEILLMFLVGYIVGPTAALDYILQHRQDYIGGSNHTFKFFLAIFGRLGLVAYQPPPQDDFIFVPFPTNVLTVYRYYIADFGLYGALTVMAVIGSLQTLVYRKARSGSRLAIYFFAITLFETLMVIFSDEYASFGAYIDSLAFAVIYIVLRSLPMRILPKLASGYGIRGESDLTV
jgi:oligosaccharide repeat unit polymerase